MNFSLNNRINRIQTIILERESNYNRVFNILLHLSPTLSADLSDNHARFQSQRDIIKCKGVKEDFQTDSILVKRKISDIIFRLKKGNNVKTLQIELEKFKCSDYDKVIFFFDCWIFKFNELMDFNLFELFGNDKYFIVDNPKEQKQFLVQFIECVLDLMANDMSIENEKMWIKIQKPIRNSEKPNIFNSICRIFYCYNVGL